MALDMPTLKKLHHKIQSCIQWREVNGISVCGTSRLTVIELAVYLSPRSFG